MQLLLDRSGQVTVYCGATEIGQGSDDVLAGLVAEALGIDTGSVRCVTGDTGITPIDLGSYVITSYSIHYTKLYESERNQTWHK